MQPIQSELFAPGPATILQNRQNWIAVASAEHVNIGRAQGFMQVRHGKQTPLQRLHKGDVVIYYSPTGQFGGNDRLQSFTSIGIVKSEIPYQADMGRGFRPYRHDVEWTDAFMAPIAPLLPRLELTAGLSHWGAKFRFGLVKISAQDMTEIATAMAAAIDGL